MDSRHIAALGVIFFSSLVRATFGFGDGLIAMPLLGLLLGFRLATPVVGLVAMSLAFSILVHSWRDVDVRGCWRLVVSSVVGIPLGLFFLKRTPEAPVQCVLAVVIIAFAGFKLHEPERLRLQHDVLGYVFGFIAGILGGAYNTNGPPIVVFGTLRDWDPKRFRSTLQGYFLSTGVFILIGHATAGLWTAEALQLYLAALPVAAVALLLGNRLNRRIPAGRFDRWVHALLLAIGLFLLVQGIRGLLALLET